MANHNLTYYACQSSTGNLIGIDYDSGGYPWVPTTISRVKFWPVQKDAQDYADNFLTDTYGGPFKVVEVKLVVSLAK